MQPDCKYDGFAAGTLAGASLPARATGRTAYPIDRRAFDGHITFLGPLNGAPVLDDPPGAGGGTIDNGDAGFASGWDVTRAAGPSATHAATTSDAAPEPASAAMVDLRGPPRGSGGDGAPVVERDDRPPDRRAVGRGRTRTSPRFGRPVAAEIGAGINCGRRRLNLSPVVE